LAGLFIITLISYTFPNFKVEEILKNVEPEDIEIAVNHVYSSETKKNIMDEERFFSLLRQSNELKKNSLKKTITRQNLAFC
tara:strand:- start:1076 stop:1318 length:243 start_codon:yes stop_codon:yes gene_type:complete